MITEIIYFNITYKDFRIWENCIKHDFQITGVVETQTFLRFNKIIKIKRLENDERTAISVFGANFIIQPKYQFFRRIAIAVFVNDIFLVFDTNIASGSTDCATSVLIISRYKRNTNQYHEQKGK